MKKTSGPSRELQELYERYAHRVYARCRYVLRDEAAAEDAMQEVFMKAHKNLKNFRNEASPLTWLNRIATNHCLNILRAKKAAWHEKYRNEVKTQLASQEMVSQNEIKELLALCLEGADPEIAAAAVYYFVDGMSQDDIGTLIGISAPTLRKRLREFMQHARERLQEAVPGIELQAQLI